MIITLSSTQTVEYIYIYIYQSHKHKTLTEHISSTEKEEKKTCICNNKHILRPLFENHIQDIMQKSFKLSKFDII